MVGFLNQPHDGTFLDLLGATIERDDYSAFGRLSVLVAYAKTSGVRRLAPYVARLREAGGVARFVVGLGQTNTSFQALELLLAISDEAYVFHNENITQTFHPKIYLLEGRDQISWVSVGSSNLTAGGLSTNYESNAHAGLDTSTEGGAQKLRGLLQLFEEYSDETSGLCLRLTAGVLQELQAGGYVHDEVEARQRLRQSVVAQSGRRRLFRSVRPPEPPAAVEAVARRPRHRAERRALRAGFYKHLSNYDASRTSSPGQIQIPIQFRDYFPALGEPHPTGSGGTQSEAFFDVLYATGPDDERLVRNARVILYEPAPDHPRPNIELRFTFRSREILEQLTPGDVLVFRQTSNPRIAFRIEHLKRGDAALTDYDRKWAPLT